MINYFKSTKTNSQLQELKYAQSGGWIRVERPSDDEISELTGYGIDIDLLSDAIDPHEVPRVEYDEGWTYFITRVPSANDDFNDYTTPILFAIDKNYLITLSRDSLGRLWQPFIDKAKLDSSDRARMFIQMMETIIASYQSRVAAINRQMRATANNLTKLRPSDISTIVEYERKLNDYLDAIIPSNVAVEKLLGGKMIKLPEDDKEMVEDLSVDLEQLVARCKSLLRTITNLRDSYRAVMDTRLNETMRTLTVVTVSLTIPTMLAGLFGMNVGLPVEINGTGAFWTIVIASVLSATILSVYFFRKR